MSVRSTVGVTGVLALVVVSVLKYPSWREQRPPAAGVPGRNVPVLLVATWQSPREFRMSWTVNGAKPPAEQDQVSPWEKEIYAAPGSTVTLTVTPLIGGPGEHTCQIEEPPGIPLKQPHAGLTGGGTTPIMCTAVILA